MQIQPLAKTALNRQMTLRQNTQCSIQCGFSLVEVMIGLGIFAIGMLGVAKFTSNTMHESASTRIHPEVMQFLSQKVEPLSRSTMEGSKTIIGGLPTLTVTPSAVGEIGIKLNSAIDGNSVNLINFDPIKSPNVTLRPPYTLVVTMSYKDETGVKTFPPVTRVIGSW